MTDETKDNDPLHNAVATWTDFLDNDFEPVYEVVFKPRGFSRDQALVAFMVNNLRNAMTYLLSEEDDDTPEL